jgi:hypothetical protein
MKPAAGVALVVYAGGIPTAFLLILFKYRVGIRADQELKLQGLGNSASSNPHYHLRRRFQKLYSVFEPTKTWWRLVLMARKFLLVRV